MGVSKSGKFSNNHSAQKQSYSSGSFPRSSLQKLEKKKLKVTDLQIGMTVVELDRPWTDIPVDFQEITIHTHSDIALLQKYCNEVYVDYISYTSVTSEIYFIRKDTSPLRTKQWMPSRPAEH